MKKLLCTMLTLVMLLSLLPAALAEDIEIAKPGDEDPITIIEPESSADETNAVIASGECGETLTWTLDEAYTLTISGMGEMKNYIHNDDGHTLPVYPGWYSYRSQILRIVIEDGATSIGKLAFADLSAMREAVIPQSVTAIRERAFIYCSSLQQVTVPGSVSSVGNSAFYACRSMKTAVIEFGVTQIEGGAFANCEELASASLPASLTTMGSYAFGFCEKLADVEFDGYTEAIAFNKSHGWDTSGNDDLYKATWHCLQPESGWGVCGNKMLWRYNSGSKTLTVKGSGSTWDHAFNEARPWEDLETQIVKIVVGEGATGIGSSAFEGCSALKEAVLPDMLRRIGDRAFCGCTALTDLTIPESVTALGTFAFQRCTSLSSITLGPDFALMGNYVFYDCSGLKTVIFLGSAPVFDKGISNFCFSGVTATARYPAGDETWTESVRRGYGGTITWVPYVPGPGLIVDGMSTAGIALGWAAIDGVEKTAIERKTGDGTWQKLKTVKSLGYTDADVQMGATYQYRAQAYVNGAWTEYGPETEVFFNPFSDVSGKKTIEYVAWAYNNEIVKGTGTKKFSPDNPCTRIQFVMMLWKMHGSPEVGGTNPFTDISGTKTVKAILWALDKGIVNSGRSFNPDGNISRIQIVMMLWKLAGSPKVTGENPFTDVSGAKTINAVLWAYQNGITTGTGKTTFAPNADCTRVQLVVFLYKYNGIYKVI